MATITKRRWRTRSGKSKAAWVFSYIDRNGQRHRKQFDQKKDAENERIRVEGEIARGVHVADRASITVLEAANAFLSDFEELVQQRKREFSTLKGYDQHIRLHLAPYEIASMKLSRLTGPDCVMFATELEKILSDQMAVRVLSTLKTILKFANLRGWIATNPARNVSLRTAGERVEQKGVRFPSKDQLKSLLEAGKRFDNTGKAEALIFLLLFSGLRISELRGLKRIDLKLQDKKVQVTQRADKWQRLGPTKSKNSRRVIPLPSHTLTALKHWLIAAPHSALDLVFPNGAGNVESYANIYNRIWCPVMKDAGLSDVTELGVDKERIQPWFGLHALRHAAVSLWIEQGATPKKVMTWAGHHSIQFTMDTYGHLWDDPLGDAAIAEAIERSILDEA